jgi:outer membrane immunogenic protein
MRKQLLCGVAALAVTVALNGPTRAADMAAKAPPPAPVVAPLPNWSGFYLGGTLGYGWTKVDGGASEFVGSNSLNGGLVGVHSGFNWQNGQWVIGYEGDYSGTLGNNWSKTAYSVPQQDFNTGVHGELNGLSSIRARLGWAFDRTLIYATGGIGWAFYRSGAQATEGVPSFSHVATGAVVGGGIEWRYNANFSFRLEGFNYFFNKSSAANTSTAGPVNASVLHDVSLIRAGASYHF